MDDKKQTNKKSSYLPNPYNNSLVPPQPGPQGPLSQKSWNSYSQQLHEYLFDMVSSIHFSSLNTVALFVSPFTIQVNGSGSGLKATFWRCELDLSISSSSLSPSRSWISLVHFLVSVFQIKTRSFLFIEGLGREFGGV